MAQRRPFVFPLSVFLAWMPPTRVILHQVRNAQDKSAVVLCGVRMKKGVAEIIQRRPLGSKLSGVAPAASSAISLSSISQVRKDPALRNGK